MHEGDDIAVERARIARAFAVLLGAAVASLMAHYAARMGAIAVCLSGQAAAAAITALRQERDAALLSLRQSHRLRRDRMLRAIRSRRKRQTRFASRRIALIGQKVKPHSRPLHRHGPVTAPETPATGSWTGRQHP